MENREVGNWVLGPKLGEGGMGEVYLAHHKTLGTQAAVKALSASLGREPRFRERFFQEAVTHAQLRHPHIAQVLDYFEQDEQYYLVIEYLEGGSLADVMEEARGPVEIARALGWVRETLAALDHAHQKGIIHRDIKPSNIMLDAQGRAKVLDFGIAKVVGARGLTTTGTTVGTPHYMSPEQITRPKEMDHRSDVYSMGVVLFELVTGDVPFDGETDFAIKQQHISDPPPLVRGFNPDIPVEVERILSKAMAKRPDQRYGGCGEFAREVALCQSALESGAREPAPPPADPGTRRLPPRSALKEPGAPARPAPQPRPVSPFEPLERLIEPMVTKFSTADEAERNRLAATAAGIAALVLLVILLALATCTK